MFNSMTLELITFGQYLASEFENQRQALAEPMKSCN
jgi:hypothetical protein